jgi:excisionase family DNA binding protein
MNDDEVRALALLLLPYRRRVEAVWRTGASPPASGAARVDLLTVPQAAERLNCSRAHIYNLVAVGKLKRFDIALKGSKVRLSADDVDRYIAASELPVPRRTP